MSLHIRPGIALLSLAWAASVALGMFALQSYETAPGPTAAPAASWPHDSRLSLDPTHPTLIMFAHPRCPCTRASIGELAQIMAHNQGRVDAHVLFLKPAFLPNGWEFSDLWRSAAAIPGVRVSTDPDGVEAKRFGALTSGHVVLYSPAGCRLFTGGITESRGHAGDNAGQCAVASFLAGEKAETQQLPVFGCTLFTQSACDREDRPCRN